MHDTTRNATLADLADLLREQHGRKLDVVAPAARLRARDGMLHVEGVEPIIDADGVTQADGVYRPTAVCDEGIAAKLGVPVGYLRRLREQRTDLYDQTVTGLLRGSRTRVAADGTRTQDYPADPRSFLVRTFRGDGDQPGVARAFLSDSYRMIDHLDVLTAALDGVRQAGVQVEIDGADLTDRRMYVRVVAPQVQAYAPQLLAGYRSPFGPGGVERVRELARREGLDYDGQGGEPVLFAGFLISNSETGGGAFSIVPRMVVQVCRNGLTVTADALRSVHLGSRMDEGVIRWTDDTQEKNLALVTAKARDAVATFLDVDYMRRVIDAIEAKATTALADPAKQVATIGKRLAFDEATTAGVLDHFIRGGQTTLGGVMQAVTSYAQTVADADRANDLEETALRVLELA